MLPDLIIPMAMAGPWIPPSPRGRTKDAYLFLSLFKGSSRLLFLYLLPDLVPASKLPFADQKEDARGSIALPFIQTTKR